MVARLISTPVGVIRKVRRCLLNRRDHLELLFSEEVFPVLVLSLKLLVGTLNCGLLLVEFSDLFLKDVDLLLLLLAAPHGTLPVLESLTSLLVLVWIVLIGENSSLILNLLLNILLLLLGKGA